MLNIWKRSSHPKAETYLFPDTEELESKELETAEAEEPLPPMEEPEQSRAEEPPASTASLQYAQVQADQMLLEARHRDIAQSVLPENVPYWNGFPGKQSERTDSVSPRLNLKSENHGAKKM